MAGSVMKKKIVSLLAKATFYLNYRGGSGSSTLQIGNVPEVNTVIIKAVCAYL